MGQAKARGTYDERVEASRLNKAKPFPWHNHTIVDSKTGQRRTVRIAGSGSISLRSMFGY